MKENRKLIVMFSVLLTLSAACINFGADQNNAEPANNNEKNAEEQNEPVAVDLQVSGDEPILVTGTIPFTSPFFINMTAEPFVMLEDQAGFINRDEEFVFPLESQTIGPVWSIDDNTLGFSLSLPTVPQGTLLDVDQDNEDETGVMVFGVAFWANIWGGPFLEEREGTGWSTAHTTTITDPERDYEISGGYLIIWSPDDQQSFPSGFGDDGLLFTEDDPIQDVPAGYSIVDLNEEPFDVYKESNPEFALVEGSTQVKDYSDMSYVAAWDTFFEKVSREYPFTTEKKVDWDGLYTKYTPLVEDARTAYDFFLAVHDFSLEIPDAHIGVSSDLLGQLLVTDYIGSFGMRLAELSDGRVIVTYIYPRFAAEDAGIEVGAEIITWDGQPVTKALDAVIPILQPSSTEHSRRQEQLIFLTRYPDGTSIEVEYQNPETDPETVQLVAEWEVDSLLDSYWYFGADPVALPIEAEILPSGVIYIKISTFNDDYNLMAQTWEYYIEGILDAVDDIKGVIIDVRQNGGGSGGMAHAFAGYFVDEEQEVYQSAYYNELLGEFEYGDYPAKLKPGPMTFDGPVVVLVGSDCVSACEIFAYLLSLNDRATIIGHTPTAGAFGEVGRGQYTLPGDIDVQFPTGRSETMDGQLLIEGVGVIPDIAVPVTYESALGLADPVLQAAEDFLLGR
jgi:C-terminal processing protease CtpA/Prc